jgi:fatty acid desaturase
MDNGMETGKQASEAYRLVADLMRPRPLIYWTDLLLSAAVGWGALLAGCRSSGPLSWGLGVVATLALYRVILFIHELTHLKPGALPGFRTAWNLVGGIPLLLPSFMYIGVHLDHHHPKLYGTKEDPEYYALAPASPLALLLFVLVAALAPLALAFRFLVLVPVGHFSPLVRRHVIESGSSLCINPAYKRRWPRKASEAREWTILESLTTLWCWALVSAVWHGVVLPGDVLYGGCVGSAIAVLNQFRTLVAHRWENHDDSLSLEEQLLDSVNYPGPLLFTELWAPLGLRYHALHHYLPGLPYHSLRAAHDRLMEALPGEAAYRRANSGSFIESVKRMMVGR